MVTTEELQQNDSGKDSVNKDDTELTSDELKEKGNECVKGAKYKEAILHYTHAIKLKPDDFFLYSNRSFAFLKHKLYYNALHDADIVITLRPDFVKGYFRKAEVLRETMQYEDALINYGRALEREPNNLTIINIMKLTVGLCNREEMLERSIKWICAAIGIIIGIIITISDQLTKKPSVKHPTLMVLLVIMIAFVGFGIGKGCRYYMKLQRKGLIEPTTEFFDELNDNQNPEEEEIPVKKRNRYTKGQARLRFRKGLNKS